MTETDPLSISGQLVAEKYRIEQLVGEGGFAVVYLAEHTIWKQPVAIKFFSGLSQAPAEHREELLHQFIQEGALLTELSSQTAGIVQARDVGAYTTTSGQWVPYMVLEWLDGTPLDAILQQDQRLGLPWSEAEVVGFLKRILPILDVAHRRGIAHRDFKPANIFMMGSAVRAPETPCKLLDFGVAKMVSEQAKFNADLAKTGVAITSFTPRYGAPEQFTRSHGATGPWTDVYAVALVASEMLAGKVALQGEDFVQYGFSSADPDRRPTPRSLGAQVSDQVEAVFVKALAVRPADRFSNAGEFLESVVAATEPLGPAVSRAGSTPSPSAQLAPTGLIAPRNQTASAAKTNPEPAAKTNPEPTTKPEPSAKPKPAPPRRKGGTLGTALLMLIVLAGGAVIFSTTDFRGAKETRAFISSVVHTVKKEGEKRFPDLQKSAQQVFDRAVASLPTASDPPPALPKCPPSTQRVISPPATETPGNQGGPAQDSPAKVVCVDEHPLSEVDYAACTACEQPGLPSSKVNRRAGTLSEFCITGKAPTEAPILCMTWKQADAFCQNRAGRLPTEEELRAVIDATANDAPKEWTHPAPKSGKKRWGPFRCVSRMPN
jgi:serine/threonine protein kinase